MEYVPDFDYGFIATVNKTEGEVAPQPGAEGIISQTLSGSKTNYIDIKVTGIPATQGDALVVFCLYVTAADSTYYLDNNTTSQSVLGQSYNGILN